MENLNPREFGSVTDISHSRLVVAGEAQVLLMILITPFRCASKSIQWASPLTGITNAEQPLIMLLVRTVIDM